MIQVVKEHVVPCPQCIEKRCGLAAENSDDLFLVKKTENSIAEFRAGAFQIAEFVDYRPLGSGLNGAGYRSDAEPKEAFCTKLSAGKFGTAKDLGGWQDPILAVSPVRLSVNSTRSRGNACVVNPGNGPKSEKYGSARISLSSVLFPIPRLPVMTKCRFL